MIYLFAFYTACIYDTAPLFEQDAYLLFIAILAHVSCFVNLSNLLLSQIKACLQHVSSMLLMKCVLIIVCAMNYGMRV